MGSSAHVYIGPYFRCVTPFVEKPAIVQRSCTSESCNRYGNEGSGDYCQDCGSRMGRVTKMVKSHKVTFNDVREALPEDALSNILDAAGPVVDSNSVAVHIWIGNAWPEDTRPPRKYGFVPRDEAPAETQLSEGSIAQDKSLFQRAFTNEESILWRLYGAQNVQLCWGIIAYVY